MPPDTPNKTTAKNMQLLKTYREKPSLELQQSLIQLNQGLVHKAIIKIVGQEDGEDTNFYTDLVEVGLQGLTKAIQEFNQQTHQEFRSLAVKHIRAHIHLYLQEHPPRHTEHPESILKPIEPKTSLSIEPLANPSTTSENQHPTYRSFRLAPEDTHLLQKVIVNLDKKVNSSDKKPDTDELPSGPLKSETLQLLKAYRANPSSQIRNRLVQLNIGLVRKEAYHWVNQCAETYEDLLQVGSMGLIRAVERFDMDRGHAFSSFAVPYIRGEIQHYLRDKSPTVRMPRQWLITYNQACKITQKLRTELKREPSERDVANALNISVSEWQEIKLACQNRSPVSLDAPVHDDDDNHTSLGDLVPDHRYRSFQLSQEDGIRLQQALAHLEERTREVVEFVFIKEFTHREVAETLGISAVTVSRQVKKGITLLKQIMNTPLE